MWHGQQAFRVWLLGNISIKAWTMWHGQQAFKVWLLEHVSIKAWTTWHGQPAFKVWLLVGTSIRTWTMWHGQQAFRVWLLENVSIRAWTTRHGQQAFKVWLLVGTSIRTLTKWHGQHACKVWLSKAWTMWHGQQAFRVWLLGNISIKAWTMWHGQQAFRVWLLGNISIKAWTMWHGQQAFKVWLLEHVSIKAWTTWHGQQAFRVWLLENVSIKAWTTWHGQPAFKVLFSEIRFKVCKTWMCCQGHWVTWRLESCRWNVELPQPWVSPSDFKEKGLRKEGSQKVWAFEYHHLLHVFLFFKHFGCIVAVSLYHAFLRQALKGELNEKNSIKAQESMTSTSRDGFSHGFWSPIKTKHRGTTWWNAEPWAMTPWSQRGGWDVLLLFSWDFFVGLDVCFEFWSWFGDGWHLLKMVSSFSVRVKEGLLKKFPKEHK